MADAILAGSGIYVIRNIIDGKVYVGSAVNIDRRFKRHKTDLNCNRHHSIKLQRAWNKHGAGAFEFSVVETVLNTSDLVVAEQRWIDELDAFGAGYNSSARVENCLGVKHSDQTRQKVRERSLAMWADPHIRQKMISGRVGRKQSEETKKKIAASHVGIGRGVKQPQDVIEKRKKTVQGLVAAGLFTFTRQISAEQREKMIVGARSPEARKRRSDAMKGTKQSPEMIAKRVAGIKAANAARPRPPISDETRKKMSDAQKGVPKREEDVARMVATVKAKNLAKKLANDQNSQ